MRRVQVKAGLVVLLALAASASAGCATRSEGDTERPPARTPGRQAGVMLFTRSGDLYTVAPDGSGLRLFVRHAADAAVSRDGEKIVFIRDGSIWQMRRDGSGQRQVTRPPRPRTDWDPTWSPDGRTIYLSRSTNEGAIYSVRLDGSGLRCLTDACRDSTGTQDDAAASPDGRIVAYSESFHGGGDDYSSIEAMTPTGHRTDLGLPISGGTHQFEPAWSPTGRKLAYAGLDADALSNYGAQRVGSTGIYVTAGRPDDGVRRIARPKAYGATMNDPAWSADGQWISFTYADGNGRTDIWLVRADGGGARTVTSGKPDDTHSTWLPPVP